MSYVPLIGFGIDSPLICSEPIIKGENVNMVLSNLSDF